MAVGDFYTYTGTQNAVGSVTVLTPSGSSQYLILSAAGAIVTAALQSRWEIGSANTLLNSEASGIVLTATAALKIRRLEGVASAGYVISMVQVA